ncbi:hypothetical protein LIER_05752 [Lithospermum erythrorhizon]|uniref:DUF4283 domain-containing protein n=1 Tax=Lithospermum erythrorhizon TaxID=34254 RepID=A0AAV3P302_LITER
MAGGDQPPPQSPPSPTEEVAKQPSPTGEVVTIFHANNTAIVLSSKKPTYSSILKDSFQPAQDCSQTKPLFCDEQATIPTELKPTMVQDGTTSVRFKLSDKTRYLKSRIEDFTRLWMRTNWYVKGFPMRMFKWTDDFNPNKESPLSLVWVHFEGLPLYLFNDEALFSIANTIGSPLRIDQYNVDRVKLGSASVCVSLDVSKPNLDKIWVAFEEDDSDKVVEGFWEKVSYDIFPSYCTCCNHLGHVLNDCKRKDETYAQLVNNSANSNNEKEVKAKPDARKTKEWVEAVLTGAKKVDSGVKNVESGAKIVDLEADDSNPF